MCSQPSTKPMYTQTNKNKQHIQTSASSQPSTKKTCTNKQTKTNSKYRSARPAQQPPTIGGCKILNKSNSHPSPARNATHKEPKYTWQRWPSGPLQPRPRDMATKSAAHRHLPRPLRPPTRPATTTAVPLPSRLNNQHNCPHRLEHTDVL